MGALVRPRVVGARAPSQRQAEPRSSSLRRLRFRAAATDVTPTGFAPREATLRARRSTPLRPSTSRRLALRVARRSAFRSSWASRSDGRRRARHGLCHRAIGPGDQGARSAPGWPRTAYRACRIVSPGRPVCACRAPRFRPRRTSTCHPRSRSKVSTGRPVAHSMCREHRGPLGLYRGTGAGVPRSRGPVPGYGRPRPTVRASPSQGMGVPVLDGAPRDPRAGPE
jgi:hypothetical protein